MLVVTYKDRVVHYRTDKRGLLIVLDDQRLVRVSMRRKKVKLRLIHGKAHAQTKAQAKT